MITRESIDRVMEAVRIEEVIGDYVQLKKSGSNFKGLSPFANEKTPSFYVSPAKQIFKDFSSGQGGDAVSFIMKHEHLSYPEAIKMLAEKYQIEIEEDRQQSPEEAQEQSERESLHVVNQFAQEFFEHELWKSVEGQNIGGSYFKERGFTEEIIKKYHLGYSPDKWEALKDAAQEKGYKTEYLIQSGLLRESKGKVYDGYKGRVIFPIHNLSGRPVGFGGRTLKTDKKVPKYINSPENLIYHKSNILYGIYQAKSAIIKQDVCYLVEGYTDVISLAQAGIENVVASSGTALTEGQIKLIARYSQNITILYDGDAAGIKASFRGIDLILKEGLNVKVVLFPDGEDPDSFAQKHTFEETDEFIKSAAKDFIVFKADVLSKETANDPIKRSQMVHDIVNSIALIPDHITRSVYIKECSGLLDIDEQALINEMNKVRSKMLNEFQKKSNKTNNEQKDVPPPPPEFAMGGEIPNMPPPEAMDFVAGVATPILSSTSESSDSYEDPTPQEKDLLRILINFGDQNIKVEILNEEEKVEEVETPVSHFILNEIIEDDLSFENPTFSKFFEVYLQLVQEHEKITPSFFMNVGSDDVANLAAELLTQKYSLADWERNNIYVTMEDDLLQKSAMTAVYAYKNKKVYQRSTLLQNKLKTCSDIEEIKEIQKELMSLQEVKIALSKYRGTTIIK